MSGSLIDTNRYASLQVNFNFSGVEDGSFRNGNKFSPQALISGAVLPEVYSNIDSPNFIYADLVSNIRISPNFNGAAELKSVVTQLLSTGKRLTTTEYSEAVSNYTSETLTQAKKM